VIAGRRQHVVIYEQGGAAVNGWIQFHTVDDTDGTIDPEKVADLAAAADHHWLPVSMVCVENTHMPSGGTPWPIDRLRAVVDAAGGRPVHLDGARLFNAEVASGVAAADYAARATTVMSCLSKGLAAPVGSLLAGPAEVIEAGRVERKRLGGSMRQAGIIAAAGLVALETMIERLAEDHERARRLAEAVAERWPDGGLDPVSVRTNCAIFRHPHPAGLLDHFRAEGVLAGSIAPGVVRLMTHLDVDDDGIDRARKAIATAP
jgi:threonine aldolase